MLWSGSMNCSALITSLSHLVRKQHIEGRRRISKCTNLLDTELAVFQRLRLIWSSTIIKHTCETWKNTVTHKNVFLRWWLRFILSISRRVHITNEDVMRNADMDWPHYIVKCRRQRLVWYSLRLSRWSRCLTVATERM